MAQPKKDSKPSRVNHPSHYTGIKVRTQAGQVVEVETVDLMEALFGEDIHLAQAFKYMGRAGKKKSASYIEDVAKCIWWCIRVVNAHGGHADVQVCKTSFPTDIASGLSGVVRNPKHV